MAETTITPTTSPNKVMTTDGTNWMTVELVAPGVMFITAHGRMRVEHFGLVSSEIERFVGAGQALTLVADVETMGSYESGFRECWEGFFRKRTDANIFVLLTSNVVRLAVNLVGMLLKRQIQSFSKRDEFTRAAIAAAPACAGILDQRRKRPA